MTTHTQLFNERGHFMSINGPMCRLVSVWVFHFCVCRCSGQPTGWHNIDLLIYSNYFCVFNPVSYTQVWLYLLSCRYLTWCKWYFQYDFRFVISSRQHMLPTELNRSQLVIENVSQLCVGQLYNNTMLSVPHRAEVNTDAMLLTAHYETTEVPYARETPGDSFVNRD